MHVTDCRMFFRISDKMHRSDIISYPVKCKQKYAIDGLISRSAQTLKYTSRSTCSSYWMFTFQIILHYILVAET